MKVKKRVRFEKNTKTHDGIHIMKRNIISIVCRYISNRKKKPKIPSRISTNDKYKIFVFFVLLRKKIDKSEKKHIPLFADIHTSFYFKNADVIRVILEDLKNDIRRELLS